MIRRTFIKALCASPLGFLLKPKRSTEICNEALKKLGKPDKKKPYIVLNILDSCATDTPSATTSGMNDFYYSYF